MDKDESTKNGKNEKIEKNEYIVKLVVIGDTNVGKTNIISRYTKDIFNEKLNATVSCEVASKSILIENNKLNFQIWDTVGQERYRSLTKGYFVNSKGVIVIFDLSNYDSFQNVNSWIEEAHEVLGKKVPLIIMGNKCDIDDKNLRKVEDYEIQLLAKKFKCDYFKVSALLNKNVGFAFEKLGERIIKENLTEEDKGNREINVMLDKEVKDSNGSGNNGNTNGSNGGKSKTEKKGCC